MQKLTEDFYHCHWQKGCCTVTDEILVHKISRFADLKDITGSSFRTLTML
jgi:hypothetical protein